MFQFMISVLSRFKFCVFLLLFIAVWWAGALSIEAYLMKIILNRATLGGTSSEIIARLMWPCILYACLSLSINLVFRIYDFIYLHYLPKMRRMVVQKAIKRVIGQSHMFFQNHFAGSISNKINDLLSHFVDVLTVVTDVFVARFIMIVFAIGFLWSAHPAFGLSMFFWTSFMVGIFIAVTKHFVRLSDDLSEKGSAVTGRQVDIFTNMLAVRLFARKKFEFDFATKFIDDAVAADRKLHVHFFWLWMTYGLSFVIMLSVNLYVLVTGLAEGALTVGDFGLVLTINIAVVDALWQAAKGFTDFAKHSGKITQTIRMLNIPHSIVDAENAKDLHFKKGEIRFENVGFGYIEDKPALFQNLNMTIKPGEKVGLVGYSGGGKTSFVNLILRLYDVQKGKVFVDDQDISKVTQDSLHETIGMIPQDPTLFHRTLRENIAYGNPDVSDETIMEASKKAHAHDFICGLKEGYEAMVGERGIKLSGGQRQRIAIARAFVKNAPILMLDEATSQMDSLTESKIQESLFELMQGKTTLVIAHRLSTLLMMDRILVFEDGQIVEEGSHEDLINKNGLYKKLWDTQIGGYIIDEKEG